MNCIGLGAITNREHGVLLDTGALWNWIGESTMTNAGANMLQNYPVLYESHDREHHRGGHAQQPTPDDLPG